MLLELAIGDAYGAGFEFSSLEKVKAYNDLTSYQQHGLGMTAGSYTDDTQMSLALAELIIDGTEWTRENIADSFVNCFKRDVRLGYSKGFQKFLESVNNSSEFLEQINHASTRNGAAMRSAPLGIIKNIDDLLAMSELQASVTHNTEIGIKSAQAVALAAHFFIYNKSNKKDLLEFVSEYSRYAWSNNWKGEVECCGEQTVNALLTVLSCTEKLQDVLIQSVNFSGDVDTVASLGLGIANLSDEFEKTLPSFLHKNLENNAYGREYLEWRSDDLMSLV